MQRSKRRITLVHDADHLAAVDSVTARSPRSTIPDSNEQLAGGIPPYNALLFSAAVIVLECSEEICSDLFRTAKPVCKPVRLCEAKSTGSQDFLPKCGVQGANSPVQVDAQTCTRLWRSEKT